MRLADLEKEEGVRVIRNWKRKEGSFVEHVLASCRQARVGTLFPTSKCFSQEVFTAEVLMRSTRI